MEVRKKKGLACSKFEPRIAGRRRENLKREETEEGWRILPQAGD